jgi:hypothetical protein
MHLLYIKYLTFHKCFNKFPPYAIFSHTWGDKEVTMEDMLQERARSKKGFKNIDYCATQALKNGYDFIWVHTCCILKTSSSELSEAINSMFQWYGNSKVCYAYLADVEEKDIPLLRTKDSKFRKSRWFTRGWTLQELLAPSEVLFYSADWKYIGSEEESMGDLLEEITGINLKHLDGFDLQCASISERMFWASKRKTTRREDITYCLLGIFNVNMPLLYGEGDKAFFRLQEEILDLLDLWLELLDLLLDLY